MELKSIFDFEGKTERKPYYLLSVSVVNKKLHSRIQYL